MTQDDGNQKHRHPDTVAYLEALTESEAAVHPPVIRASMAAGSPGTGWRAARSGAVTSRRTSCRWRASGRTAGRFRRCSPRFRRSSARSFRSWRRTSRRASRISTAWSGRFGTAPSAAARRR